MANSRRAVGVLCWMLTIALGCGDDEGATTSACVPGASDACACEDGREGAQLCNAAGTFEACVCDGGEAACGDGIAVAPEQCDDGNDADGDGCSAACTNERCGDGIVQAELGEACDDGAIEAGDGCSASCQEEVCGDGLLQPALGELCDDGGTADDDGCDADCQPTAVTQIVLGTVHTCALLRSGAVRCFGGGFSGQLGYGNPDNIGDDEPPLEAGNVDVGGKVTQLTARYNHTCALLENGDVVCWGSGDSGRLGYASTEDIGVAETPASVGPVNLGEPAVQVSAGNAHTCALLTSGAVRCWGDGDSGRLGYGNTTDIGDTEDPTGDVQVGGMVQSVHAGGLHTCALLVGGSVRCWGDAEYGQLGYANQIDVGDVVLPSSVGPVSLGGNVVELSVGATHNCAVLDTGAIRCWGYGDLGKLGTASELNVGDGEVPSSVPAILFGDDQPVSIHCGGLHTCAFFSSNHIKCFGAAGSGRLGYGNLFDIGDTESPAAVGFVPIGAPVTAVVAGGYHTCVITTTGHLRCHGDGSFGETGHGYEQMIGDNELPNVVEDVPLF